MLREHTPFGRYRIQRRLGAGGMGEVYLAFDTQLQRDVAIKVLKAEAGDVAQSDRVLREARTAATLRHPNICTIFEAGEIDSQPYIAMEFIVGRSVATLVEGGRLPIERVVRIGAQIADGLTAAHAHGVVHRDLKPANILIDAEGRATILDFGIAAHTSLDAGLTMTHDAAPQSIAGTLPYMAPETLRGQPADVRSDIWALGVVLYEMATGNRPFAANQTYELASAILLNNLPEMPETVPGSVQAILRRCLAKEPGERYQHASEIRAALDAAFIPTGSRPSSADRSFAGGRAFTVAVAAALFGLVAIGWTLWKRSNGRPVQAGQIHSIAVLPLANLSGDPAQDFFADGMTEALITDLARVKGLDVISRTSVMQFKTAPKPVKEVARVLGVDVVVEGSVIRSGDRVRITAQLIDGSNDRHLWANDYDRDVRDVLALQHDVARAIASEIRATLSPAAPSLASQRRVDPVAHERYLKGRALVFRYNEPSIAEAIELLQEAVKIEPEFADAWAALAAAHSERGIWGRIGSRETAAKAREAITRALALDADSSEAYATLANINMVYDWQWAASENAAKRSIELAPGSARAHQVYHQVLQATGHLPEAIQEAEVWRKLDPASPLAASAVGRTRYKARRFESAIDAHRESIAIDPTYGPNYARLADVYIALGRYDQALQTLDQGQTVSGGTRRQTDGYGVAYALAGRRSEAEAVLRELIELSKSSDQAAYSIAMVQTALGHHDQAIEWLNRAYQQRSANMFLINVELKLEPLRSDVRFRDLLQRMGFTDSARTAGRSAP
jgi:serine/threonine-protein kinase